MGLSGHIWNVRMWSSEAKHIMHLVCFFSFVSIYTGVTVAFDIYRIGFFYIFLPEGWNEMDPVAEYGLIRTIICYLIHFTYFLFIPQLILQIFGLTVYNTFPGPVKLKSSPKLAPFLCFRVVTKGDYPDLVKENIEKNMKICRYVGLENFTLEVITDKPMNLEKHKNVREIVIPNNYRTKFGSLFKARALQYCWEENVNKLKDEDWVVHLDEETLMTEDSIRGILNFSTEGTCQIGEGQITYGNGEIVNWITTIADSYRVADEMGRMRFEFKYFASPLTSLMKGSFLVIQAGCERDVTFDHGPDGSVSEDCYFGMMAHLKGYKFDFLDGEMHEKSPFTILDFIKQKKRWFQGIFLMFKNPRMPMRIRIFLTMSYCAWFITPICLIFDTIPPVPTHWVYRGMVAFIDSTNLYMHWYGMAKQFGIFHTNWLLILFFYTLGAYFVVLFTAVVISISIIWAIFTEKHQFHIVKKQL